MKRILTIISIALALFCFTENDSFAKTYPNETAKVTFMIPDSWKVSIEDDVVTASTKDEAVTMVFSVVELNDVEAAINETEAELKKSFTTVTFGEPKPSKKNGMDAMDFEGQATKDGITIIIAGSAVVTPANKVLLIFAIAAQDIPENYVKDLNDIEESITGL